MTQGRNLLLSFFCPFFIHFTIWTVNVNFLQRNYSPAFVILFDFPICCSLHTHIPKDNSCHPAPASSIPADVLHFFSMLAMKFPALHMMAGAESLPIATEKHYTGLQMLLLSVALKILAMPVPLRGHWRWLQSVLWGWCSFSWEKWSPNIRLSFQPCLSTGNHLWELMWVTCDLLIINFILLRHMELSSQLSVTRKTAQLSFNVKAYHSHVKRGRLPFLSAYLPITSKWHFCSQRELQTGGLHCS